MAFADPQSVTLNAVAQSLPRVYNQGSSSIYSKDDGLVQLTISHTGTRRFQRRVRLTHAKIAADPLSSGTNVKYSMSVSLVVDVPTVGYTVAEQKYNVDGLIAYLSASSGAKVTQLLGGEN
jgi:hypothetical protein